MKRLLLLVLVSLLCLLPALDGDRGSFREEAAAIGDVLVSSANAAEAQQDENRAAPQAAPSEAEAQAPTSEAQATPPPAQQSTPFSFDTVIAEARALAAEPYAEPTERAPRAFGDLTYDQYRRIEFIREEAEWAQDEGSAFRVHYVPQGFLYKEPVRLSLVENGTAQPRPLEPSEFRFFDLPLSDEDKAALRFAGFRITTPLNAPGKWDEVISFQGASFFRALGVGNTYGTSARGLAIGTGSPTGEEFPAFRAFWLEHPAPGARTMTIYALMDSRSVAGAFRFVVTPGLQTGVDVEAVFFPRRDIAEAGIAPLTSMFDFGPQDPAPERADFRPGVHDAGGLGIVQANGEWVWRPLTNPERLEISSFAEQPPRGFGLLQRSRDFKDYEDIEARYDLRPSVWIEPREGFGLGRLVLVEIPTDSEVNDNIVTFWRPAEPWRAGSEVRVAYRMSWGATAPVVAPVADVTATRTGRALNSRNQMFAIDFDTQGLGAVGPLRASVTSSQGEILNPVLVANPHTGGHRLSFEIAPGDAQIAELRAQLLAGNGDTASETWLYRWRP
ncbi:glucan biosynthesis protein [Parvularcula dongshanensis]|uniref:Glucans biosynthesis protein G n=1 Tax=Parvularcula dongshanensis TaxID=1173995 RepID=A0A840I3S6_9PROT|nr:glucans biosynthesis protein [Parvularcula dongshanensis]